MPWKNIPPDWLELIANLLGIALAGMLGTLSRILDQIKAGHRERIWSKELLTDTLSFLLMVVTATGVSEYFEMGSFATAALAGILCRGGTPLMDKLISNISFHLKGPKK